MGYKIPPVERQLKFESELKNSNTLLFKNVNENT